MKNLILMAAIMVATIAQATEPGDTVTVNNAQKVTIVNNDSLLHVTVNGTDSLPDFHYEAILHNTDGNYESSTVGNLFNFNIGGKPNKKTDRQSLYDCTLRFFIGFNGATGNSDVVKTKFWKGANIGTYIDWGIHPWRNGHRFSMGVGVEWKNFRMISRQQFVKADNGTTKVEPLGDAIEPKFSRIKTFSVIVPLMYTYEKQQWGFSVGAIVDFTTHSSIKTRYKLDGNKYKQTYKDLHPNTPTVDFLATFINPVMDIYVKYSPCNVLDTQYGPKFHSLSLGIIL